MRVTRCTLVLLAAVAAGCGGNADDGEPVRVVAASRCAALAKDSPTPVLCPAWLPGADQLRVDGPDYERSACAYLVNLNRLRYDPTGRMPEHAIFGGRCRPFDLETRAGRWPAAEPHGPHLRLIGRGSLKPGQPGDTPSPLVHPRVADRTTVDDEPALLLTMAPFPRGGIHGGHYAIVWNRDGAGYAISLHSPDAEAGQPPSARIARQLRRAAESMEAGS